MNINILDFLLETDVVLKSHDTGYCMIADEMYELGGEFVVYDNNTKEQKDIYRGNDFEKAVKILQGLDKDY